ncbi:MAG: DUF5067 domain-containing protein [Streptococcaceae bacterium]|jgi:outer membrane murein-binding lipoprotein Lpp|nr:DUF5067 domain-containing protein [Streptococcaceae bacterium]
MKKVKLLGILLLSGIFLSSCSSNNSKISELEKENETLRSQVSSLKTQLNETNQTNVSKEDSEISDTFETNNVSIKYEGIEKGTSDDGKNLVYLMLKVKNKGYDSNNYDNKISNIVFNNISVQQNIGSTTKNLNTPTFDNDSDYPNLDKLNLVNDNLNINSEVEIAYAIELYDTTNPITLNFIDKNNGEIIKEINIPIQ